jgi:diguanylate cyclase (GGDEF)-like protein/PAS domain S-box-containing protein
MFEKPISKDGAQPADQEFGSFFNRMSARINAQGDNSGAKNSATQQPKHYSMSSKEALLLLQSYEESRQGWFWSTDSDGNIVYITEYVAEMAGGNIANLQGKPFVELFAKSLDHEATQRSLPFIFTKNSKFEELRLKMLVGEDVRWWSVSGQPQFSETGEFSGFRGNGVDITEQLRASHDTEKLAHYDSLTGLANRANMQEKLEKTLKAFQPYERPCAVALLDLDRFKQVNDTLGHPAGDTLLQQVAQRLRKAIGIKGEAGRLGGDEFQILIPDCDDRGDLGELAETIISSISQPYSIDGSRCIIGASIGIAISPFDGESSEDLIRNADLALYAAKSGGRGRFQFYSSDLHQSAEDRRMLEEDLRDALSNDQMTLAYQPLVNAKTNIVTGFEALMRWNHPERGPISPALFIPIAEEANLINVLGEWAINKACEQASQWPGKARVAVNVSPIQFANEGLPDFVAAALARTGLAPDRLELEVTEGVFLEEYDKNGDMFDHLKNIGVRLALDDFGTGYSSMSYLQSAPFDKIKIDRAFVRGATQKGSRNGAIIKAIVALAEALDMETTAEGLETLDELDMIRDLNVSHIQGYVYSAAVPNEKLLQNLEDGEWVIEPIGPAFHRDDRISMFRKVHAIHHNHRYQVVIRNLSATGALIEGLLDVPLGTEFVIDFGDGQLAVSTVKRSKGDKQGIQFEERLVGDGSGGLCTARRVSRYLVASMNSEAGLPNAMTLNRNAPATSWQVQHVMNPQEGMIPVFNSSYDISQKNR